MELVIKVKVKDVDDAVGVVRVILMDSFYKDDPEFVESTIVPTLKRDLVGKGFIMDLNEPFDAGLSFELLHD